jgi:DNA-binding response OmpR family regulator
VHDALASVLDELGFECDRATSAAIAANMLASRPYDAALVGIEMPIKTAPSSPTRRAVARDRTRARASSA